jgi:ribosomal protein L32
MSSITMAQSLYQRRLYSDWRRDSRRAEGDAAKAAARQVGPSCALKSYDTCRNCGLYTSWLAAQGEAKP